MSNVKSLSDASLLSGVKCLIAQEREITLLQIEYLREIEVRMIHLSMNYSSLWKFCTEYLGLSEGSAQRRIRAAGLARDVPQAKLALKEGKLSFSNACKLQSFFVAEKKSGKVHSTENKVKIVQAVEGLSQQQCEKKLFEISPATVRAQQEIVKPISADQSALKIVVDSALLGKLNLLKGRLAHKLPNASYSELIGFLANSKLEEIEAEMKPKIPKAQKNGSEAPPPVKVPVSPVVGFEEELKSGVRSGSGPSLEITSGPVVDLRSRRRVPVPVATKRLLWQRSQGKCEFISVDGKRCLSTYAIQIEHAVPWALGGSNELSNLFHFCRSHNLYAARGTFGREWMSQFVPRFRRCEEMLRNQSQRECKSA